MKRDAQPSALEETSDRGLEKESDLSSLEQSVSDRSDLDTNLGVLTYSQLFPFHWSASPRLRSLISSGQGLL